MAEGAAAAGLPPATRRSLLALARESLVAWVLEGRAIPPPRPAGDPRLAERRGAFVTLKRAGQLRGCVGVPLPSVPLADAVAECAAAAATRDPRFPPVGPSELGHLCIEISVLGVPRAVSAAEVVPGVHGLLVSRGGRRGLLLPQVAAEHGWDREVFLAHVCRKAGLGPDAWRGDARLEVFTAEVFGEE